MPIFYFPKIIFVIWPRCPAGNELAPPDTALKYYTLTYRLQKGHLANYVNLLPMTASGQSMPMRSAPMSHDVGNCLKADVPGSGGKVKRLHFSRRSVARRHPIVERVSEGANIKG
jgi:hypothetical protein